MRTNLQQSEGVTILDLSGVSLQAKAPASYAPLFMMPLPRDRIDAFDFRQVGGSSRLYPAGYGLSVCLFFHSLTEGKRIGTAACV